MAVENSLEQAAYPNNPNPYTNTLTDFGWTEIVQETEGLLVSLNIDCNWTSYDYPSEATFWLGTPWGENVLLYAPPASETVPLSIETFDFAGQPMAGT